LAILPVIVAPDPRLKERSAPVGRVDDRVRALLDDMLETMYGAPGVGLSAIQVGVPTCLIVVDIAPRDGPRAPLCLVNPEVVWESEEMTTNEEGCLSLPDQFAEVTRPAAVAIRYVDDANERRELRAEGMLATCIQHEMDHLDGVLFVDHISSIRRNIILRKLVKARKAKALESV
jgi:peptide deformylase